MIVVSFALLFCFLDGTGSYLSRPPRRDMQLYGSTGSVSMLRAARKHHKLPTTHMDCVNCVAPSHLEFIGLFGCPPNVCSLHMTRCDRGKVCDLRYVYVGSFRSSSWYVTTSHYFPVTHFPLFILQVILKEFLEEPLLVPQVCSAGTQGIWTFCTFFSFPEPSNPSPLSVSKNPLSNQIPATFF